MAKETILNRGSSSAIDCILPFACNCAIGVSTNISNFHVKKRATASHSRTFDAIWFCLCAALNHWRGGVEQVFDTLARDPKSVDEVSRETGASPRGLRAIMNALVGLELLAKRNGKYALTPESENFLVRGKPGTLAGFFSMKRLRLIQLWMKM